MAHLRSDPCSVVRTTARRRVSLPGPADGDPARARSGRLPSGAPLRFNWQDRPYRVVDVLSFWLESGAWWRQSWAPGAQGRPAEREVWRVEAVRGGGAPTSAAGVYDLVHEPTSGRWWLARVWD